MKKYLQLIIGFCMLLFLGVAYAWSLFVEPLESEFGWHREQTSMIFTISMICFCLGGLIGSIINSRISHRLVLLGTACGMTFGFILCANIKTLCPTAGY